MIRRILFVCTLLVASLLSASAQIVTPIKWSVSSEMTSADEGRIVFHATVEEGWHLYGLSLPDGGPKATSVTFDRLEGLELVGSLTPSQAPVEKVDMGFQLKMN